jgi:hypothetical protein
MAESNEELSSEREHWQRLSQFHFERANSYGVWLLTNLVLVNGAAGAAVLSQVSWDSRYLVGAALMFSVGVILSMIAGFKRSRAHFLRQRVYYGLSRPSPPPSKVRRDPRRNPLHKKAEKLDACGQRLNCWALVAFGLGVAGSAVLLLCIAPHDRAAGQIYIER